MARQAFSDELEAWLRSEDAKTVGSLGRVFQEKSFAVTVLLLMFLPAIPAPTGGITHVFEASRRCSAPSTISAPSNAVIASKTCVMPPVGAGIAGEDTYTSTVTAKLFSWKTRPS